MTRRRFLSAFLFLELLRWGVGIMGCREARTAADVIEGAACGFAYSELGTMPPGCDIPVPVMKEKANELVNKAKAEAAMDALSKKD